MVDDATRKKYIRGLDLEVAEMSIQMGTAPFGDKTLSPELQQKALALLAAAKDVGAKKGERAGKEHFVEGMLALFDGIAEGKAGDSRIKHLISNKKASGQANIPEAWKSKVLTWVVPEGATAELRDFLERISEKKLTKYEFVTIAERAGVADAGGVIVTHDNINAANIRFNDPEANTFLSKMLAQPGVCTKMLKVMDEQLWQIRTDKEAELQKQAKGNRAKMTA